MEDRNLDVLSPQQAIESVKLNQLFEQNGIIRQVYLRSTFPDL